jgi:prepilin-type N-terminal cleavage/methylation domain-containing protein
VNALRARILRSLDGSDDGLSLTELIVAMAIASVVLVGVSTMFVSSLRQNRTVTAKTITTADARIGMEAMTRAIRVAVVPTAGTSPFNSPLATPVSSSRISVYSSLGAVTGTTDPLPTLVTFYYDATKKCLVREMTPSSGSLTSTCIARGRINSSGAALFTYYPLAADGSVSPTPYASTAITSNLPTIASVAINLEVTDPDNLSVRPTKLQDQVTMINIATALQAGQS